MTLISLIFSVLMGAGALGWIYAFSPIWYVSFILGFSAIFWLIAQWRQWTWYANIGLVVYILAAGLGIWLDMPAGWMLAGVIGGLTAWDLSEFMNRLRYADEEDRRMIEPAHLARVGILLLIGLALSSAAMLLQVQFTFAWTVFLVLFGVWGLSLLVRWIRRRST